MAFEYQAVPLRRARNMKTRAKTILPGPPTVTELAEGFGDARLSDLQGLADLLARPRRRDPAKAVEAVAKHFDVSPATVRRRFGELARCAGWEATTPDDHLAGRKTQRGGYRHGVPSTGDGKRSMGGAVNEETRQQYEAAQATLGDIGLEAFILRASAHVLAGRRPLE